MGSDERRFITLVISVISLNWSFSEASTLYNSTTLDAIVHDYVKQSVPELARTGYLYNVFLPENYSGMEVSVIRFRSGSFWSRGANYSSFRIPPRTLPIPYAKRLAIVYSNLGNWSSSYFDVPGYSFVSPVVGFSIYDASGSSIIGDIKLNLSIRGNPISVQFTQNSTATKVGQSGLKGVQFRHNGSAEMFNMTEVDVCVVHGHGYYSIVVPIPPPNVPPEKSKVSIIKWWIIGLVALVAVAAIGILNCRCVSRKRMEDMERQAQQGVAFDTQWIRESKMPTATMTRTRPSLETEYAP